jgi:hypothetical protein
MKACEGCGSDRVVLGRHFPEVGALRRLVAIPLIYVPILIFIIPLRITGSLVYWHLRLMGAENLKTLADFLPDRRSHRYSLKSQITFETGPWYAFWQKGRLYWIFNCTMYCPYSVALLEWVTYMTKIVENWWCPFKHAKKDNYASAAIDQSLWHIYPKERAKLHPEDRENPIWNDRAEPPA